MRCVATFDLNNYRATYQFLQFLINAELSRPFECNLEIEIRWAPLKLRFGGANFEEAKALYKKVMLPSLQLIGAKLARQGEGMIGPSQYFVECVIAARGGIAIPKWKPPKIQMEEVAHDLKGRKPIVVTLRECRYWPGRNSNFKAWKQFARRSGEDVIFVRDTAMAHETLEGIEISPRASTDFLYRAALMFSAKANLFVANGPSLLAWYSDVPFLNFKLLCPEEPEWGPGKPAFWHRHRMAPGDQLPWSSPTQRLVWENDELKNIERNWANISKVLKKAA